MSTSEGLTDQDVAAALAELSAWTRDGEVITATYRMATFPTAIELVDMVATSAEAANHHPDIDIRWRKVTFRLTTHDAGRLTVRDLNLARRIEGHATALGWAPQE